MNIVPIKRRSFWGRLLRAPGVFWQCWRFGKDAPRNVRVTFAWTMVLILLRSVRG